jgi:uncharacterized membrane protein
MRWSMKPSGWSCYTHGVSGTGETARAFDLRGHAALALALVPTFVVARTLLGETPLSYDHATHLFKAWHFCNEMLGQGRLRGWSHFWGFGFPADELVPSGGEVWITLARLLTFGQLSWLRTYALAFFAFLLLKAFAVFVFSRRQFGPAAAVLATWIATLDPGATLEGGWLWHTRWGVWPVTLSVSFGLLALCRVQETLDSPRLRDVLWAAAYVAAALHASGRAALVPRRGTAAALRSAAAGRAAAWRPRRRRARLGARVRARRVHVGPVPRAQQHDGGFRARW